MEKDQIQVDQFNTNPFPLTSKKIKLTLSRSTSLDKPLNNSSAISEKPETPVNPVNTGTSYQFKTLKFNKTFSCPFKKTFVPKNTINSTISKILGVSRRRPMTLSKRPIFDPNDEDAIVLYEPKELSAIEKLRVSSKNEASEVHVVVDPILAKVLRPHQVEGVKFMFRCTTGMVVENAFGCIMADEMGLGKTLQCITLLWTLIKQSPAPMSTYIKSCIIVCPSSLVKNWANEIVKWIGESKVTTITCDNNSSASNGDSSKTKLRKDFDNFFMLSRKPNAAPVLIISYETLRANVDLIGNKLIGLMLCDEGHKLKNSSSQTYVALNSLNVKRRVILSGTPIQNDLTEYFSLFNFANPDLLGSTAQFRKNYEIPILKGRDAMATDKEKKIGDEKLDEMNNLANKFIIRRTNNILSKYLPTKYEYIVFCKLNEFQEKMYELFIKHKASFAENEENKKQGESQQLKAINILKKLCNHPNLVKDNSSAVPNLKDFTSKNSIECNGKTLEYSPKLFMSIWSSKFTILEEMLINMRTKSKEKIVIISNYTQTLDLIQELCYKRKFTFLRLDGTMSTAKRQKLVDCFNHDNEGHYFIFLLSSKAGGCGINLIGANRLILFDPDWNPASDMQALARVWRDGQKKTCFIYRFITTGTIEEKIFQRQSHKQTLSRCVVDSNTTSLEDMERYFSADNLKKLFKLNTETNSETHDTFKCKRCVNGRQYKPAPEPMLYSDTSVWDHFSQLELIKIYDSILRDVAMGKTKLFKASLNSRISFVFQFKSHDKIEV